MRIENQARAVLVSCMAVSLLASCGGVPESSEAEVVGPAPTDFDQSSSVEADSFLPTDDAILTVDNFLRAASGDPAGRDDRLREFTTETREFSAPVDGIGLLDDVDIALGEDTADLYTTTVIVTGSVVGTYLPDGQVRMNDVPREYEEEFVLEREGFQEDWAIPNPPSQVVMLREQFERSYGQAPLYFQATGRNDLLVPDLRWIYRSLDESTDNDIRLDWLIQGTSEWVRQSARSVIPPGTTPEIVEEDGVVRIDLTLGEGADPDGATTEAIAAQIAWSLSLNGRFELLFNGEERISGTLDDWRGWNAVPPSGGEEIGYFIASDTVWQFADDAITDVSIDHPWVGFSAPGLAQVAVAADDQIAALVAGEAGLELRIGRSEGAMGTVEGLTGDLRDPQWLTDGIVMLIDDGVLTAADAAGEAVQTLAGESVQSLAVARDGHRIAYVEDGRAWAAPLSHDADGNLQIGQAQRIGLDITEVTDVAWGSEDFIWVSGERAGYDDKLFLVSIDNAEIENQPGTSGFPLAQEIAATPADPVDSDQNRGEPNIVVIGADLYRVHTSSLQQITDAEGGIVQGAAPFTVVG